MIKPGPLISGCDNRSGNRTCFHQIFLKKNLQKRLHIFEFYVCRSEQKGFMISYFVNDSIDHEFITNTPSRMQTDTQKKKDDDGEIHQHLDHHPISPFVYFFPDRIKIISLFTSYGSMWKEKGWCRLMEVFLFQEVTPPRAGALKEGRIEIFCLTIWCHAIHGSTGQMSIVPFLSWGGGGIETLSPRGPI